MEMEYVESYTLHIMCALAKTGSPIGRASDRARTEVSGLIISARCYLPEYSAGPGVSDRAFDLHLEQHRLQ